MRLLKIALTRLRSERGQALILAALAMVVLLGFAALSIDVGYWYSQKREVQKAVDAAALAGAQDLPDDYVMAESKAREYLTKNGITDEDTISITFRCTSTYQASCNPGANKWDTIVVEVERPAEAWFAKVFGIQEALVKDVRAAGCNGACGGSPFVPVDVVQILDRTGSMDDGDMAKAKDGARALLEYFEGDIQRVGLAVLPGSQSWSNPCPSSESSTLWLPVNLSDDYQNSDGTLRTGSRLVSTINCLQAGGYTNVGDPMAAAVNELQTNGRTDVKWGIILLTDGVANRPLGDTGNRSPTANAAAPGGDNNGFQTTPTGAYADGGGRAEDPNSGTNTSTGCGDASKDRHDFYNYGISVPSGNTVVGIEVRLDAWISSTTSTTTRRMCVQLSWDGGVTWTTAKQTNNLGTSQQTYTLGGSGDTWGHTWTLSQLSDANFRVRVTNVANNTSRTFYLDWAAVRVYHLKNGGPCAYAAAQADIARAAGIEVFTIGYGMHDPTNPGGIVCNEDRGAWQNVPGYDLLEYMATDSDHFFDEPSTADLRPIFEVIGSQLASGSRLVE
jgi:hypothetical protein